jgi:hypothetical protein
MTKRDYDTASFAGMTKALANYDNSESIFPNNNAHVQDRHVVLPSAWVTAMTFLTGSIL